MYGDWPVLPNKHYRGLGIKAERFIQSALRE
jgi:hypothetical protein